MILEEGKEATYDEAKKAQEKAIKKFTKLPSLPDPDSFRREL